MVLNERAVDDEMYDADSEEVNLFSGIENDDEILSTTRL